MLFCERSSVILYELLFTTTVKMLSWNENAAICFLSVLRDPSIVMYLMSILKPMRRDFVEEEARDWHKSLRISQKERWERVAKLSKERKFSQMIPRPHHCLHLMVECGETLKNLSKW